MSDTLLILVSLAGILLSMLFSAAEISLIRSNPLQINVWKKQKKLLANYTSNLIESQGKTLVLILIGINFSNVLASSFLTILFINNKIIPDSMIIPVISILILIFAEVLPKTISKEYSNTTLLILTPMLIVFKIILYPLVYIFTKFQFNLNTEIDENELKPLMAIFLNKILKEQSDYEKKNKSKPIGGDAMFDN